MSCPLMKTWTSLSTVTRTRRFVAPAGRANSRRNSKSVSTGQRVFSSLASGQLPNDPKAAAPAAKKDQEIQGVFKLQKQGGTFKAQFVPVKTGITGSTDIEVLEGLKKDDQIVTGSYKVLRTLKNGASVKVDNSAAKKDDEKS